MSATEVAESLAEEQVILQLKRQEDFRRRKDFLIVELMQDLFENGLVIVDADPYLYPLITSAIIFLAVLLDSTRYRVLARLNRRKIRLDH